MVRCCRVRGVGILQFSQTRPVLPGLRDLSNSRCATRDVQLVKGRKTARSRHVPVFVAEADERNRTRMGDDGNTDIKKWVLPFANPICTGQWKDRDGGGEGELTISGTESQAPLIGVPSPKPSPIGVPSTRPSPLGAQRPVASPAASPHSQLNLIDENNNSFASSHRSHLNSKPLPSANTINKPASPVLQRKSPSPALESVHSRATHLMARTDATGTAPQSPKSPSPRPSYRPAPPPETMPYAGQLPTSRPPAPAAPPLMVEWVWG